MTPKLNNCKCGGKAKESGHSMVGYWIECTECEASTESDRRSLEKPIEQWNKQELEE